jgi:hypothetical protein
VLATWTSSKYYTLVLDLRKPFVERVGGLSSILNNNPPAGAEPPIGRGFTRVRSGIAHRLIGCRGCPPSRVDANASTPAGGGLARACLTHRLAAVAPSSAFFLKKVVRPYSKGFRNVPQGHDRGISLT